jgi:hypothetical protein
LVDEIAFGIKNSAVDKGSYNLLLFGCETSTKDMTFILKIVQKLAGSGGGLS